MKHHKDHTTKVLFILKRRGDYNPEKHTKIGLTTGLYNSASFMSEMLVECGVASKIAVVNDNNDIDREVHNYKPTHIIIEALWVVPSKFTTLCKLHPKVRWIIRMHSEVPFVASEGNAMDWLGDYVKFKNLTVAANSPRFFRSLHPYLSKVSHDIDHQLALLENYYPEKYKTKEFEVDGEYINIGCFGAIRPLKNHLQQALAAIKFADKIGKKLRFHINADRIEMKGDPVLNNLKGLFMQVYDSGHELVNHGWFDRDGFLKLCAKVDIGMQVSISETFNIVGADLISQGVPIVASYEIPWSSKIFSASGTDEEGIYKKLLLAYYFPRLNVFINKLKLKRYTSQTRKNWLEFFKNNKI